MIKYGKNGVKTKFGMQVIDFQLFNWGSKPQEYARK